MAISATPINILLVEDNPGDVELVRAGFEEASLAIDIQVISDGQAAVEFFDSDAAMPDLVLLDINLPKVSGIDVLKKIRNTARSQQIPVVILTSSDAELDIVRSYVEHANSFISKPVDFDKFMQVVKSIEDFWLTVVKLPRHHTLKE